MQTGSPSVNAVDFVLQRKGAVTLPILEPDQYFGILVSAVTEAQPNFRQLFNETLQDIFESEKMRDVRGSKSLPNLPPVLSSDTKCTLCSINDSWDVKSRSVIVTRNGELYLWCRDRTNPVSFQSITPLTLEVFLQEFEGAYPRAVGCVVEGLARRFNLACENMEFRIRVFTKMIHWFKEVQIRLSE